MSEAPVSRSAGPADGPKPGLPVGRLASLALAAAAMIALGLSPPVRQALAPERIEALASEWGWRAPALLFGAGVLAPLLLIPRWPICALCGLLFGIARGALLAVAAATVSAWIGYRLAECCFRPFSEWVLKRFRLDGLRVEPPADFRLMLWLRAVPFSSFTAVNLLAATLRLPMRQFLAATFAGLLPSSLLYAAWGRLPELQTAAALPVAAVSGLFLLAAVIALRYCVAPWLERERARSRSGAEE